MWLLTSIIVIFIRVMLHSEIHYGLCRIMLFINGYIALSHSSMVHFLMDLSHCNIYWRLRWIETFHFCTFLNGFVALQHSSRVMLDFDVHKGIYWIMTFINTYVVLRNSSILHSLMVLLHSDIHCNDRNIYSRILKFIITQRLSHIIRHHVVRIFLNYICQVITPDSLYYIAKCKYLYNLQDGWVSPPAKPFRLPTSVLFIYLQSI